MAATALRTAPAPVEQTLASMRRRIAALGLDLSGLCVLTEAATGAYACTAVIAAMAGAHRVLALARDSARHGSARDAAAATLDLARAAGVESRIDVVERLVASRLGACDILTNSGHLRPINRPMIERLPQRAVIALMYEAWEFRPTDVDLAACRERGVRVAAVNERHRDVAVFPFLGELCVRLLASGGLQPEGRRVALLCDNPFEPFIRAELERRGAVVRTAPSAEAAPQERWDAVVLALNPCAGPPVEAAALARLTARSPNALIAQFWGDMDRPAARDAGFRIVPAAEPSKGHMGVLLNELGPEPIVRLQAGGLRAAEIVLRGAPTPPDGVAELL